MKNSEVAKIVKEKLEKKGYDVSLNIILDDLDISVPDEDLKESDIDNVIDSFLEELEY